MAAQKQNAFQARGKSPVPVRNGKERVLEGRKGLKAAGEKPWPIWGVFIHRKRWKERGSRQEKELAR